MKIYIVGTGFDSYINWIKDAVKVTTPEEADLLLFGGGADVDPSLYGENLGKYTYTDLNRDKRELAIFNTYIDKPKLGICRGLN